MTHLDDRQLLERFDQRLAGIEAEIPAPTPWRRPAGRADGPGLIFGSLFSVTKFVVAGAIVALFGGFLLAGMLTEQPAVVPGAASESPATPGPSVALPGARSGHSATLLSDGRVLIVGGRGQDRVASEVWDPATGTVEPAGSLATRRHDHTATLLPDGRVLVVGGMGSSQLKSAEIWDPTTERFAPAGSLTEGRKNHTGTLLPDGRVLIVGDGNQSNPEASAEIWDPATETFGNAGSLAQGRYGATATPLPDGRVLVVGGYSGATGIVGILATAEVWDPTTASFDPAGSLAQARDGHTATLLSDGRVLVIGGVHGAALSSAEVWDPNTDSFTPTGSLAEARGNHTASLLPDGRVLVIGGGAYDAALADVVALASAEIWDPTTDSFVPAGSLAAAHGNHTATLLPDDRVLVMGEASVEVWEPSDE